MIKRRGMMFVLSSPSGAGKTTLARLLLEADKHLHLSISYTTRQMRPGEINGQDYYFITREEFEVMIQNDQFLEYAEIFGNMYGTPRSFVDRMLENGEDILFDIEWQGCRQLRNAASDDVVSVFIFPPSKLELLTRLRARNQDSEEVIIQRIKGADEEISHWSEYDYSIINRNLNHSLRKLTYILRAERLRKARRLGVGEFANKLIHEKAT